MIETDFVAFHSQLRRFRTTRGRAGGRRASGCSTLSLGLRLAFWTPGLEPAAPWAAAVGLTAPLTVRPAGPRGSCSETVHEPPWVKR